MPPKKRGSSIGRKTPHAKTVRASRDFETEEKTTTRRQRDRLRSAAARLAETPEAVDARRRSIRQTTAAARAAELREATDARRQSVR